MFQQTESQQTERTSLGKTLSYYVFSPQKTASETSGWTTPLKKRNVPWKLMVGRCIFLLKWSPFLGDIRSFWANLCISPSQWASPDISCCFIERYHDFPTSNASFYPLDPINPHICSSATVWGSCLILRQLKRRPCLHLKCHIFKISTHFGNIVWKKKEKTLTQSVEAYLIQHIKPRFPT